MCKRYFGRVHSSAAGKTRKPDRRWSYLQAEVDGGSFFWRQRQCCFRSHEQTKLTSGGVHVGLPHEDTCPRLGESDLRWFVAPIVPKGNCCASSRATCHGPAMDCIRRVQRMLRSQSTDWLSRQRQPAECSLHPFVRHGHRGARRPHARQRAGPRPPSPGWQAAVVLVAPGMHRIWMLPKTVISGIAFRASRQWPVLLPPEGS